MPLYVLVSADDADKVIRERVSFDGTADELRVPRGAKLLVEADAVKDGYTYQPPEPHTVLRERAESALAINATYLERDTPTNAQNLAQIRALTRECTALIRLVLDLVDTTDGT